MISNITPRSHVTSDTLGASVELNTTRAKPLTYHGSEENDCGEDYVSLLIKLLVLEEVLLYNLGEVQSAKSMC